MKTFEPKESEIAARELLKQLRTGSFEDWIDRTAKAFNQYANQQNTAIAAELAQVRKEREWVSVNEPPKTNGKYLVWDVNGLFDDKNELATYVVYNNHWYCESNDMSIHPTHWMPLPAAPDNIK